MEKKTYRLTADIGDLKRGATVKLTAEKATSPLYASRIAPVDAGSAAPAVDLESIRTELRKELLAELDEAVKGAKKNAEQLIADAQAEAKKIVEAAQAEAMKLAAGNGKK
jgi:cell division septum initiation protein DivIVA